MQRAKFAQNMHVYSYAHTMRVTRYRLALYKQISYRLTITLTQEIFKFSALIVIASVGNSVPY